MVAGMVLLSASACGSRGAARPITVTIAVGQTRTFSRAHLPARSRVVCSFEHQSSTYVVSPWSGSGSGIGERATLTGSDGVASFDVTPVKNGLIASCKRD